MSKRDPVETKQRRSADIVRPLASVACMKGVPWVGPGGRWLLGRPAERSSQPQRLAGVLLAPELPDRARLAELLGARESVPLEPQQLARWSRHLAELEASRDLE